MQEITRRGFIGAAGITAVSAGLVLAGCNSGEKKEESKKSEGGGDVRTSPRSGASQLTTSATQPLPFPLRFPLLTRQ